jgi:hypothetical protein
MGGQTATGSFPLRTWADFGGLIITNILIAGKAMNQAILAIELYDVPWTFGAFTFTDVVMVCTHHRLSAWVLTSYAI